MERTGLRFYRVEGDVGMMGGVGAHEYMAPCAAGEDEVALGPGYAANLEVALTSAGVESDDGGYTRNGEPLTIEPAIEIGNIFKLGTRYSEPLGATYLDETGAELPIWMALLRHRPRADRRGRRRAVRRRARDLLAARARPVRGPPGLARQARARRSATPPTRSTSACWQAGVEVLYDDRDLGPGEKFADAELLGCPLRLTVGRRSLESGEAEVQIRRGRQEAPGYRSTPTARALLRAVDELWQGLP